jgi:hypothetical protein
LYARWLTLKTKYGIKDDVENERPVFAAQRLYSAGLRQAGLSRDGQVEKKIANLVAQNKLPVMRSHIELELQDPAGAMRRFKKDSVDDAACFAQTLERLEGDIDAMRMRANAWAKGDIAAIGRLSYAERDAACDDAMMGSAAIKEVLEQQDAQRRMRKLWLEAAEHALATNRSTFAMLRLSAILADDGLVAALREKGYQVESPQ